MHAHLATQQLFLKSVTSNPESISRTVVSKYREYDGNIGLTATLKAGETQLEPFRLEAQ